MQASLSPLQLRVTGQNHTKFLHDVATSSQMNCEIGIAIIHCVQECQGDE